MTANKIWKMLNSHHILWQPAVSDNQSYWCFLSIVHCTLYTVTWNKTHHYLSPLITYERLCICRSIRAHLTIPWNQVGVAEIFVFMYLHLALNGKSQFFINVCLCVSQGDRFRVEILSLSFNPSSSVALDYSVHQVYVEYRLLGIPMETTETPMSLRKPTDGEEIHYNFTRGKVTEGKLITFMCLNRMLFHGKKSLS